ncbi:Uncharacterised protein [Serratia quinivorans]|uniref:hypothetical protein n=1 Tax=Serratia TaxID=613 RepID=UPI001F4C0442|nr:MULTISPECIES: hypothetical protein [Serratia]ULG13850.1 hypothetical protein 12ap_00114 [Serratia proteamaculans]ULG13992.1 hypothetical protein 12dp_00114 [Serratia proteamaculans]ULG14973.1 hypothetical protein 149p1_00088 [Serratia proteamaculans]ULG15269.1 hypothetical protein 299p_00109 [Serratia proteamaculans]ULG15382.1 hypothetical protein 336p_00113 [Serratia proteamaculans]
MNNVMISQFTISLPNGSQFYANGRQQIPVLITIQKQEFIQSVGWRNVDLNNEERGSVTVREINQSTMPSGWSVDTLPNEFTKGIRGLSVDENRENLKPPLPTPYAGAERIFRYLRSSVINTRIFMAEVTMQYRDDNNQIQRRVITTSFNEDGIIFSSNITLRPLQPLRFLASELNLDTDIGHSRSDYKGHWAEVMVYYWTLPSGVRVHSDSVSNVGGTLTRNSLRVCFDSNLRTAGWMARNRTTLRVNQIRTNNSSALVNLRNGHGDIRGFIYYNNYHQQNVHINGQVFIDIIDNFGNDHHFTLRVMNNQNLVIGNR